MRWARQARQARAWLWRVSMAILVFGALDLMRRVHQEHDGLSSSPSARSRSPLGLWSSREKMSHDDYDARSEQNAAYLRRVARGAPSQPRRFYIYPWPEDVVNRWPIRSAHHRPSFFPVYGLNQGLGPVVDQAQGRHLTHQYSLFRTFLTRLERSPLRTLNASEASLFFIPYDLGMDSSSRQSDGALARTNCPKKPSAERLLAASPYFAASRGRDHFILHSINQMMLHYAYLDGCMDLYQLCFNCTKLSLDAYGATPELYSVVANTPYLHHRWVSVPFPSDFHMSASVSRPLWRFQGGGGAADAASFSSRPLLLAYVGSEQVTAKKDRALRVTIREQCLRLQQLQPGSRLCEAVALDTHESHALLPAALRDSAAAANANANANANSNAAANTASAASTNLYEHARLCLMPGGDFPTRKGFFDALLSGCVPIIFQRASASSQWPWHWSDGDAAEAERVAEACVVHVPRSEFMNDAFLAMQRLAGLAVNATFLAAKRRCIDSVALRLQYSDPAKPAFPSARPDDAVDVVLRRLLY